MFKKILLKSFLLMFAVTSFAYADNVVASKSYVDSQIDTTQVKIPAAGTSGVPLGTTVMTYTSTSGEIGERGIYTGAGDYDASTDSGKIITAAALDGAINSIPTLSTNRLTCANPGICDLWTIVDQTAYGVGGGGGSSGIDLMTIIGTVASSGDTSDSSTMTFSVDYGDRGAITGLARCSTRPPVEDPWDYEANEGEGTYNVISGNFVDNLTDDTGTGTSCYCKLDGYTPDGGTLQSLSSPWVYNRDAGGGVYCAEYCTQYCAERFLYDDTLGLAYRAAVFGVAH